MSGHADGRLDADPTHKTSINQEVTETDVSKKKRLDSAKRFDTDSSIDPSSNPFAEPFDTEK